MVRQNKFFLLGVILLIVINISAINAVSRLFLPALNISHPSGGPTATIDPCAPDPYPGPTPEYCPTATPTYDPYPPPPTVTPKVTITPIAKVYIYLPLIKIIFE